MLSIIYLPILILKFSKFDWLSITFEEFSYLIA